MKTATVTLERVLLGDVLEETAKAKARSEAARNEAIKKEVAALRMMADYRVQTLAEMQTRRRIATAELVAERERLERLRRALDLDTDHGCGCR